MAVTSIWAVSFHLDMAISYVLNPDKTIDKPELSPEAIAARKAVGDVIDYASNGDKTEQMLYVTGINCTPESAAEEFMRTKEYWNKTDGRLAYHGYQSFLEGSGEITAKQAHLIGVRLAQELWGDRFEIVVATHLNTNHYHNHIILNSVSFRDGYKFRRTKADYWKMRNLSDRLCQEANLNIVNEPSIKRRESYTEWKAKQDGKMTVRGTIRDDIDMAIRLSHSEEEFAKAMKELGYEFKFFAKDGTPLDHPGLKPPGAKGYFRFRGLGKNYDYASIIKRIIENTLVPSSPVVIEKNFDEKYYDNEDAKNLPSAYRRYCIRLYSFICRPKNAKRIYIPMAIREDIRRFDLLIEQMDFLYQNNIDNMETVVTRKANYVAELKRLLIERKKLYTAKDKAIRNHDISLLEMKKNEITEISRRISFVRRQIKMCENLFISADRVVELAYPELKKPVTPAPQITPITPKQEQK